MIRFLLACLVGVAASACAVRDHGAVDYRVADPVALQTPAGERAGATEPGTGSTSTQTANGGTSQTGPEIHVAPRTIDSWLGWLLSPFSEPTDVRTAPSNPLSSAGNGGDAEYTPQGELFYGLSRRHLASGDADRRIRPGDSISVALSHTFFNHFPELALTPERTLGRGAFVRRGEIAILARVFELPDPGNMDTSALIDWMNLDDHSLIYFSDDIEFRQDGSLSNLPIYGPITYEGRPLYMDFVMIEIDETSAQTMTLLSQVLNNLGTISTTEPSLALARQIATAFINDNQDDVFFRFSMMFSPSSEAAGASGVIRPRLETGHYVFIRKDERRRLIDWDDLNLDVNTGRLWRTCREHERRAGTEGPNSACQTPYQDNTYFSITIDSNETTANSGLRLETWGAFRPLLADSSSIASIDTSVVTGALTDLQNRYRLSRTRDDIRSQVDVLDARLADWSEAYLSTFDSEQATHGLDDLDNRLGQLSPDCYQHILAAQAACIRVDSQAREIYTTLLRLTQQLAGEPPALEGGAPPSLDEFEMTSEYVWLYDWLSARLEIPTAERAAFTLANFVTCEDPDSALCFDEDQAGFNNFVASLRRRAIRSHYATLN